MMWLLSVLGAVLVLGALWDVFHTLWHPVGQGRLTKTVLALTWRVSGLFGAAGRQVSGPGGMAAVIGTWAALIVVGWALIYWPQLPEGFLYSTGLDAGARSSAVDALYISLVTVATLGFGDVVPTTAWLRLASPLQALMGFAILTAAVSWVLQVYPALTRRRVLGLRLETMRRTDLHQALPTMGPATAAQLLLDLAAGMAQTRVDLTQYGETYYFRDANPETTLATSLAYAQELATTGADAPATEVQQAAAVLSEALADLAELLDAQFLSTGGSTTAVLDAYARQQRVDRTDSEQDSA